MTLCLLLNVIKFKGWGIKVKNLACVARCHAAGRALFGVACGHWPLPPPPPPSYSHWPQPGPHGLPLGPQDRPGDAGRHKTNLTLARATWLLYSANCYQEPLMRNGLATSSCRESYKGCQLGILIMTREHCGGCMSSTFFGQRPLFCVTGHVNTNLSCFWLASNLGSVWWIYWLFLHAFDWVLFPRGLLICTRRKLWSKTILMYCIWGNRGDKSS